MTDAERLVQRQLDAYNARDLEAWLDTYHADAVQYEAPALELARGRDAIRARMAERFATDTAQHARLHRRILVGNFVHDHETVTRTYPNGVGRYELLAQYQVEDGHIRTATFAWSAPRFEEEA